MRKANATPGGGAMPAADYSKRQRGDGRGRPVGKGLARRLAQDLMRGEHKLGASTKNLTWVKGNRDPNELDESSRKILAAGRRSADQRSNLNGAPPRPGWATGTGTENMAVGTSIFDPVLCELIYRWFCPAGGTILDPFSGGSVRGIVASLIGYSYVGYDLRPEQIESNEEQAARMCKERVPKWICGDGIDAAGEYDLVFSCPPYGDLERYSDDPRDLSTMPHDQFLKCYRAIVAKSCGLLKPDRFACFVVGDFRDKKGFYRNFVSETIAAFQSCGCILYNEAILITAFGSLPIRAPKQFTAARKLGKTHQNVLVFFNSDPKTLRDWPLPEFGEPERDLSELPP